MLHDCHYTQCKVPTVSYLSLVPSAAYKVCNLVECLLCYIVTLHNVQTRANLLNNSGFLPTRAEFMAVQNYQI